MMLYLDLRIYKFKNICIVLILQNIPQLPFITTANTALICEYLWKQELEHKEKQENECWHYWETITLYARIHYKLIKDKLIKLSLLYLTALLLKSSLGNKSAPTQAAAQASPFLAFGGSCLCSRARGMEKHFPGA